MGLYTIYEVDDFRRKTNLLGVFEGLNENDVRVKASNHLKLNDILKYPGFYSCNIIT